MKKTNKGFSMVELIIVIAIMAILAGALAPALIKYINKSKRSSDISNADTIRSACQTAMSSAEAAEEFGSADVDFTSAELTSTKSGYENFTSETAAILGTSSLQIKYKDGQGSDKNFKVTVNMADNTVVVKDANGKQITPEPEDPWK